MNGQERLGTGQDHGPKLKTVNLKIKIKTLLFLVQFQNNEIHDFEFETIIIDIDPKLEGSIVYYVL